MIRVALTLIGIGGIALWARRRLAASDMRWSKAVDSIAAQAERTRDVEERLRVVEDRERDDLYVELWGERSR